MHKRTVEAGPLASRINLAARLVKECNDEESTNTHVVVR